MKLFVIDAGGKAIGINTDCWSEDATARMVQIGLQTVMNKHLAAVRRTERALAKAQIALERGVESVERGIF